MGNFTKTLKWQLNRNLSDGYSEFWIWRVVVSWDETEPSGSQWAVGQSTYIQLFKLLSQAFEYSKDWKNLG